MKKSMKTLTRSEMKAVIGGTNKTIWSCHNATDSGLDVCSSSDPTTLCAYIGCTNTGVACSNNTICVD